MKFLIGLIPNNMLASVSTRQMQNNPQKFDCYCITEKNYNYISEILMEYLLRNKDLPGSADVCL